MGLRSGDQDSIWVRCLGAEGGGRNLISELPLKAGCVLSSAWGAGLGGEAAGMGASSCPNPTASRAPDPLPCCTPGLQAASSRTAISSYLRSTELYRRRGKQAVESGWEQNPTLFFVCLLTIGIYDEV